MTGPDRPVRQPANTPASVLPGCVLRLAGFPCMPETRTFTRARGGGDRERRTPRAPPKRTTPPAASPRRFQPPRHDPAGGSSGRPVVHTPRHRETGRADGRRAAYHRRAPVRHDPERRHAQGVADLLHGRQHPGGRSGVLRRDPGQHGDRSRSEDRTHPEGVDELAEHQPARVASAIPVVWGNTASQFPPNGRSVNKSTREKSNPMAQPTTTSISTAAPSGRAATPIAVRAG